MLRTSKYLEIPFVDGGRDFGGCDCWGLVALVFREEFGIKLPDYFISALDTLSIAGAVYEAVASPRWTRLKAPESPCVVVMRADPNDPTRLCHVGAYVGDQGILHILDKSGVQLTQPTNMAWERRIGGYYKWTPSG